MKNLHAIKITVSKTDPVGYFVDIKVSHEGQRYQKDSFHQTPESVAAQVIKILSETD